MSSVSTKGLSTGINGTDVGLGAAPTLDGSNVAKSKPCEDEKSSKFKLRSNSGKLVSMAEALTATGS